MSVAASRNGGATDTRRMIRSALVLLCLLPLVAAGGLRAQTDYRGLDEQRPVHTRDAYPIERYAFELSLPYALDQAGGVDLHVLAPELSYGVMRNAQLGVELPFAAVRSAGGTDWGFAGPRVGVLYNFNTDGPSLPALSLGARLALPLGSLAPDDPGLTLTGVATRGWGMTRLHLNAEASLGGDGGSGVAPDPRWILSTAVDRTFLRRSLLVVGELSVLRAVGGAPIGVTAGAGARAQLTPTLVLHAGAARRLSDGTGPDLGLSVGLTYAFAVAALMPAGPR